MPKLSIITVNLNNAVGLYKTIESVLSQNFTNSEYIIIDGGSVDGSVEIIQKCDHKDNLGHSNKIDYWKSEPDSGIYNAMNKGISKAKGEYCLFLNSGDLLSSPFILTELFNELPSADIIYCDSIFTRDNKDVFKYILPENMSLHFLFCNSICHQSTLIRRSLFEIVGSYNENNKIISDWEFIVNTFMHNNFTFHHIPIFLSRYEKGGISESFKELSEFERKRYLNSLLHPKVLEDYVFFQLQCENPLFRQSQKFKSKLFINIAAFFNKVLIKIEQILIK
jgi:glycosyltransferase involved in cell wall biosynthesis